MRILILMPSLTGGGAERQLAHLSMGLQQRGHQVLVGFIHRGPGEWPDDIPVHAFAHRNAWSPFLIEDIVRLIRTWKPDLVQTCLTRMDVCGAAAARRTGTPYILREANSAEAYPPGLKSRLRVAAGRAAAAIIANSPAGARYWAVAAPDVPRFVVPNGIAAGSIENTSPIARPDHAAVGLYAGRLTADKNVDVLIRACAAVGRTIVLYVCGDGPERPSLEALARQLGVDARFTGFIRAPYPYMRAADFGALLSDFEGHSNAVAECFAAGTPMILSNSPAHEDFAELALLVPPRNVAATVAAIRRILDDPAAARERAQRARFRVAEWSIESMTESYEKLHAAAAEGSLRSAYGQPEATDP